MEKDNKNKNLNSNENDGYNHKFNSVNNNDLNSNENEGYNHKFNSVNNNDLNSNLNSNSNEITNQSFYQRNKVFYQDSNLDSIEDENRNINPFKEEDDDFDKNLNKDYLEESNKQYYYILNQCDSLDNSSQGRLVSNILLNLIESLERYLLKIARIDYIESFLDWDFHLLDSSFMNAFCMPGGKTLLYSGILSIADNEEKIAYVLSHEMAHFLLNHPRDHIFVKDDKYNNVLLFKPFSPSQERDADRLGMMILKWADYDIENIPSFCQSLKSNDNRFNYFSTHPLDDDRIENMKRLIDEINDLKDLFIVPVIKKGSDERPYRKYYINSSNGYSGSRNYDESDANVSYRDGSNNQNHKVVCSNCGYYEDSDASFCSNCGSRLDYKSRCERCGAEINPNDYFCTNCGNVLVKGLKCFNCGAEIKPGDVYCVNCGIKLIK